MAHKNKQHEIFNKIINILKELNDKFPNQNILRHISDATSDYTTLWGVENKEFLFALEKYMTEMYLPNEDEIEKILKDGKNIDNKELMFEDPIDLDSIPDNDF